jgi:hypothetical protein
MVPMMGPPWYTSGGAPLKFLPAVPLAVLGAVVGAVKDRAKGAREVPELGAVALEHRPVTCGATMPRSRPWRADPGVAGEAQAEVVATVWEVVRAPAAGAVTRTDRDTMHSAPTTGLPTRASFLAIGLLPRVTVARNRRSWIASGVATHRGHGSC